MEVALLRIFVKERVRRDLYLAADHGVNPLLQAGAVEIDHAVHHSVVGYRKRRKPLPLCGRGYLPYSARAVAKAVFGVNVKMCE